MYSLNNPYYNSTASSPLSSGVHGGVSACMFSVKAASLRPCVAHISTHLTPHITALTTQVFEWLS